MELLQECKNRQEQQRLQSVLRPYALYWPTSADCYRALDDVVSYPLAHNIGILDALIAETAVGMQTVLATFSEKHYCVIHNLRIFRPYARG